MQASGPIAHLSYRVGFSVPKILWGMRPALVGFSVMMLPAKGAPGEPPLHHRLPPMLRIELAQKHAPAV